jgi:hypothetical protein
MDAVLVDFLPHLRANGLAKAIRELPFEWQERLARLLTDSDLEHLKEATDPHLGSLAVPRVIARVRNSRSPSQLTDRLRELEMSEETSPLMFRRWRQDILEALTWSLAGSDDIRHWLRELRAFRPKDGTVLADTRLALDALVQYIPSVNVRAASDRPMVWISDERRWVAGPPAELVDGWTGWLLDCRSHRISRGSWSRDLEPVEATIWSLALVEEVVPIRRITSVVRHLHGLPTKQANRRVQTFVKRLDKIRSERSDLPVHARLDKRDTPATVSETILLADDTPRRVVLDESSELRAIIAQNETAILEAISGAKSSVDRVDIDRASA